jgi:hypothetical protein
LQAIALVMSLRLRLRQFIHIATRHVFYGAYNFQYNLLLLTFFEYYFWNNGLGTCGSATFLLSVDEPTKLLVDPKKLVAYNGLEKQMENNTK